MTTSRRVDYHPTCPTKTVNASAWTTTKAKNVAMIRISRRTHSVFLWAIFSVLAASSTSRASGLADLTAVVLRHDNYKVRLQAAAVLARRRDPRAVPALAQCLRFDEHYLVRAMCASAMGKIADRSAVPALKAALKDHNAFVRKRVKKALAFIAQRLSPNDKRNWHRPPKFHAKYLVFLFPMNTTHRHVNQVYRHRMRDTFWAELGRHQRVDLAMASDHPPNGYLHRYGLRGYVLDAALVRLRSRHHRGKTVVKAKVRVTLTQYPMRKIVMITAGSAAASQHSAGGRADRTLYHQLKLKAIDNAARSASQNVWVFLKKL